MHCREPGEPETHETMKAKVNPAVHARFPLALADCRGSVFETELIVDVLFPQMKIHTQLGLQDSGKICNLKCCDDDILYE